MTLLPAALTLAAVVLVAAAVTALAVHLRHLWVEDKPERWVVLAVGMAVVFPLLVMIGHGIARISR